MAYDDDVYTREVGPRNIRSMNDKFRKLNKKIKKWKARWESEKSRADALENELSIVKAAFDALEEQLDDQSYTIQRLVGNTMWEWDE